MKYFGTDGIRGKYGDFEIREPFFKALGLAAAEFVSENGGGKIVVGGDTRASTNTLKSAFCSGLMEGGAKFEDVGVLPTPALAFCVIEKGAKLGAMITASHNPYTDNGIKFFDESARKIEDGTQLALECKLEKYLDLSGGFSPSEFSPRTIAAGDFASVDYCQKMASIFPPEFLKGIKIAVDMANGATSGISSEVFRRYGAEVFETAHSPDGFNINDGVGSQHPENLSDFCRRVGADVGFAHDGDGDRVVVCDETGSILEGEEILGLIALDAKSRGKLRSSAIVTTLQSNIGMDESLRENGIEVFRSGIGDRLVMREMLEHSCNIGGENSGHFIFLDVSPCGDGLAAALSVLSVMVGKMEKLSKLRVGIKMYPAESKALSVVRKIPVEQAPNLSKAMGECNEILGADGRLLVRYSGTEKKIRLLVEGKDREKVKKCMQLLCNAVDLDLK